MATSAQGLAASVRPTWLENDESICDEAAHLCTRDQPAPWHIAPLAAEATHLLVGQKFGRT